MRHYLLVGVFFFKWASMKDFLMFYTFGKINKSRKIALIQRQRVEKKSMLNYLA